MTTETVTLWYYEEISPLGKWMARTSPAYPRRDGPEGVKRKIRRVTDVPTEMQKLPLSVLQKYLPQ